MKNLRRLGFLVLLALALPACGTANLTVLQPLAGEQSVSSLSVQNAGATVDVPPDMEARFVETLTKKLYRVGFFEEGDELTLAYRFIQADEGNQFERWFWGGIGNAGEGSLTIEVEFRSGGRVISKVHSQGRIGSGLFGGAMNEAVDKAAREIAEYTIAKFK